jgi:hypothetical protein
MKLLKLTGLPVGGIGSWTVTLYPASLFIDHVLISCQQLLGAFVN